MNEILAILSFLAVILGVVRLIAYFGDWDKDSLSQMALLGSRRRFQAWIDKANDQQLHSLLGQILKNPIPIYPYHIGTLPQIRKSITVQGTAIAKLIEIYQDRQDTDRLRQAETIQSCLDIQSDIVRGGGYSSWFIGVANREIANEYDGVEREKKRLVELLSSSQ